MREVVRGNPKTGKKDKVLQPPNWTAHADFINPFDFIRFAAETRDLEFDIMLEAKAKDLALQRLRRDITFYAPELQERFDESWHERDDLRCRSSPSGIRIFLTLGELRGVHVIEARLPPTQTAWMRKSVSN
ncbi:MAG: hypothetical protein ACR2JB_00520 [Bryobacteraceae bacterium]